MKENKITFRATDEVIDFLQKETLKEHRTVSNFIVKLIMDEIERRKSGKRN